MFLKLFYNSFSHNDIILLASKSICWENKNSDRGSYKLVIKVLDSHFYNLDIFS